MSSQPEQDDPITPDELTPEEISGEAVYSIDEDEPKGLWERLRYVVVHRILRLNDTPNRIAWGVFLGFVVGFTPTIGFQMMIYVAIATLLRANKVAGLPVVWISNPFTAVPLYYFNWKVGKLLLTGKLESSPESKAAIEALMSSSDNVGFFEKISSADFWHRTVDMLFAIGTELWVGSLFAGVLIGIPAYYITYRGVLAYRKRRAARRASA